MTIPDIQPSSRTANDSSGVGRRLSKREHDLDLGVLRQTLTAGQLLGKLAFLAGLLDRPEAASAAELTREFDWTHVFTKNIFVNSVFFHR